MISQPKRRWLRFINPKPGSPDWYVSFFVAFLVFGSLIVAAVLYVKFFGEPPRFDTP